MPVTSAGRRMATNHSGDGRHPLVPGQGGPYDPDRARPRCSMSTQARHRRAHRLLRPPTGPRARVGSGVLPGDSVGETSAEVREGSTKPIKVWAREHYDWSTPGTVRWTVIDSNVCTPGSGVAVTVTDGRNGGSHLHLEWERHPSNLRGRVAIVFMRLLGRQILRKYIGDVLTRLARDTAGSSGTGSMGSPSGGHSPRTEP
jgi:hypothetical protein